MTEEEQRIRIAAIKFVKDNKKYLLNLWCPPSIRRGVDKPTSLFMAGSPGAGKTETSKSLIKNLKIVPMRIDADEIRAICPDYSGTNAHLFQDAANKGVNILYDYALAEDVSCVMDGTFAYGGAAQNIERSLRHGRKVKIWFVYQNPLHAWELIKAREEHETRRVSKDVFIKTFFKSRINAHMVKEQFGKKVELNILIKDYVAGTEDIWLNVPAGDLDRIITTRYSVDTLTEILI